MKTETLYCPECDEDREHRPVGFMPTFFTRKDSSDKWENVALCKGCGGITTLPVQSEQITRAHKRYLNTLVDEGIITEEEKEKALNG